MYLPPEPASRTLLDLPEGANVGKTIDDAMKAIEERKRGAAWRLAPHLQGLTGPTT